MLLAALLGAGVPAQEWVARVRKLALPEGSFEISITDAIRGTLACKKVDVMCEGPQIERHLHDVIDIIERSDISVKAKDLAARIFNALAAAEARVHGVSQESVHFHEVGAIDAIVDVVGFCVGYDLLDIERSYASALPLGAGVVRTAHGLLPVPGPAVLNLLSSARVPTMSTEIDYECLTPTAAAILTTVVEQWGAAPAMQGIDGIGYGAGTRNDQRWPNAVRLLVGQCSQIDKNGAEAAFASENIAIIEANLDDLSPQVMSFAMDRLFEAGALDVVLIPAVMKKGRSGNVLSVLCHPDDVRKLQELVLAETSTIGVRTYPATRLLADRSWEPIALSRGGTVRVKLAFDRAGNLVNAQPEYEDCALYATKYGIPLKQVVSEAVAAFHQRRAGLPQRSS